MSDPTKTPNRKFRDFAGFYLPQKWRRWFIYLPLNLLIVIALLVAVICIRASFVSADEFYQSNSVAQDAERQFKHLSALLRKQSAQGKLDITQGYSEVVGYHHEWDAGFYIFYCLALKELVRQDPARLDDAKAQLSLCARGILKVPNYVEDAALEKYFADKNFGNAAIQAGYVGIVLGLRKLFAQDSLFDIPLKRNATALVQHLEGNLVQARAVWTSDQATQLYALWLFDRVTGESHQPLFDKWLAAMKARFIEKETGLLISQININPDGVVSPPRGTSIAWTSIFLADVFPDFAREQYEGLRKHREQRLVNLAATREYASKSIFQIGDIDSGPLIGGFSPGATGFALCTHKLFGDRAHFTRAFRMFEMFGAPRENNGGKFYYRANAMGDAILLYAKMAEPRTLP